jgi:hypothetical protein
MEVWRVWQPSDPGRRYIYGRAPLHYVCAGARRAAGARAPVRVLKRVARAGTRRRRPVRLHRLNHRPGVGSWAELN